MTTEECFGRPAVYRTGKTPTISFVVQMRQAELFKRAAKAFLQPEIKKLQLRLVITNMLHMIKTIKNVLPQDEYYKKITVNHKVFDWSIEHFTSRMKANIQHLTILRREHPRTLGNTKFELDLTNFEGILQMINDGEVPKSMAHMKGCVDMLEIQEDLSLQHLYNTSRLKRLQQQSATFVTFEAHQVQALEDVLYETIERCRDVETVGDPIYQRHKRNNQLVNYELLEHKWQQAEQTLMDAFERVSTNTQIEKQAINSKMQIYYSLIETYKDKISYWGWKYDVEYEKVDNALNYRKICLKALQNTWKEHIERIEMFHKYIRHRQEKLLLRQQLKAEAEALELAAAEAEMKRLRRLKAKEKKNKAAKSKQRRF